MFGLGLMKEVAQATLIAIATRAVNDFFDHLK